MYLFLFFLVAWRICWCPFLVCFYFQMFGRWIPLLWGKVRDRFAYRLFSLRYERLWHRLGLYIAMFSTALGLKNTLNLSSRIVRATRSSILEFFFSFLSWSFHHFLLKLLLNRSVYLKHSFIMTLNYVSVIVQHVALIPAWAKLSSYNCSLTDLVLGPYDYTFLLILQLSCVLHMVPFWESRSKLRVMQIVETDGMN